MIKKITAKESAYIKGIKKMPLGAKLLLKWKLKENVSTENFSLYTQWRIWAKVIFFIPIGLIVLIHSLWRGGLKEGINNIKYIMETEHFTEEKNVYINSRYNRMKKVFDNK